MINVKKDTVWVFDLDDTLYLEKDYQTSGYRYICLYLKDLYKKDLSEVIDEASHTGKDVLSEVCITLGLPESVKQSFLWMYRLHIPEITLAPATKKMLEFIQDNSLGVAIITDGRSVSQRHKLFSLGLQDIDALVSEEWEEVKPGRKRFDELEKRYTDAKQFVYVGDNIKKDFVTPNSMGWITIGIRDSGHNVHPQNLSEVETSYLPHIWLDSISDIQELLC